MEIVIYGILTIFWYLAATVLFPFTLLLKFNKTLSEKWMTWIFMKILKISGALRTQRKLLFDMLKEDLEQWRDESVPLEVLEIGIGGGSNFEFYPENCNLTALEPNKNFSTYMYANQKKSPHVNYKRTIYAKAENMKEVADASMDMVFATYVLCSVEDVKDVLTEVKRVLKPGGKYVFLEHIGFPKLSLGYILQRLTSPMWVIYFNNCIIYRETEADIGRAGFNKVCIQRDFPKSMLYYIRPIIHGIATK